VNLLTISSSLSAVRKGSTTIQWEKASHWMKFHFSLPSAFGGMNIRCKECI